MALPRIESLPGYAAGVTPSPLRRLFGVWALLRRFPIIPLVIVMVVMIIPAVFAPLIAPHPPKKGDLKESRLLPPLLDRRTMSCRSGAETEIDRSDLTPQITVADAQELLNAGNARIESGGDTVSPGDRVIKLKTVVAGNSPPGGGGTQYEIALKDAQSFVERGKMRIVGVESVKESSLMTVSEGQQVEEIISRGGNLQPFTRHRQGGGGTSSAGLSTAPAFPSSSPPSPSSSPGPSAPRWASAPGSSAGGWTR